MPRGLEYGIEKRIRVKDIWQQNLVQVFALAEDEDTPYVIIRQFGLSGNLEQEIWLEDFTAKVLIKQITKALDLLPSSK